MTAPGLNFGDFTSASKAVLEFLQQRLGFGLWMVTRTEGNDWIVLQRQDQSYGVEPGRVFKWADSFCVRMVQGQGPLIAPQSALVPAYAQAPINQQLPIQAYAGVPLTLDDGRLFGTLCAIDPSPQPPHIVQEQALLELLGGLLSTVLSLELKAVQELRRAEQLQNEAYRDPLTQLYNRRGWDNFLSLEEERCRRYGHSAAVIIVDLDKLKEINDTAGHKAGDALIMQAATALHQAVRSKDIVARLGGDEFGVLAVECDHLGAQIVLQRLRKALSQAGVQASSGVAIRHPQTGLAEAWEQADIQMYLDKQGRQ